LIHADFPDQIIAFAKEVPLCVGLGCGESYLSSDPSAFSTKVKEVVYLQEREIAILRKDSVEIFDENNMKIDKKTEEIVSRIEEVSKGEFEHYTLKEIFEQPQTLRNVIYDRYMKEYGTAHLEGLSIDVNELAAVERILILGCGSSYHAGLVGAMMLQDLARIPTSVEISSEFRYSNPIVSPGTFVIAISQSGETADTIAAMRELKTKGARILALVNMAGSTIARDSDSFLLLRAGPEIGVCSTKAFTNQVTLLSLFALLMARLRHMNKEQGIEFIEALEQLPAQVEEVLSQAEYIRTLAKKYAHYDNFFFLGRRYMYPTCLEGALKLKEISYINANGYPAGEMKHGPIALISPEVPTIAYCANKQTYQKILSNLMEVKARSGKVLAIVEAENMGIRDIADDVITIPDTIDPLTCICSTVVSQLFAYFVAFERGENIDQPRNLAKSVTVE
jgi:glucosamine--fructose-6-phosphate aminotransferase (isomerizing)